MKTEVSGLGFERASVSRTVLGKVNGFPSRGVAWTKAQGETEAIRYLRLVKYLGE